MKFGGLAGPPPVGLRTSTPGTRAETVWYTVARSSTKMLSNATIDSIGITGTGTAGALCELRSSALRSTYVFVPEKLVNSTSWVGLGYAPPHTTRSTLRHGLSVSRQSVLPAAQVVSP